MAITLKDRATGKVYKSTAAKAATPAAAPSSGGEAEKVFTSPSGKIKLKKTAVTPAVSGESRVGNTILGGVKSSAAQYTDAARALYAAGQGGRTQRDEAYIAEQLAIAETARRNIEMMLSDGEYTESEMSSQRNILADAERKLAAAEMVVNEKVQEKATESAAQFADDVQQSAQKDIAEAKDGLGAVGRFMVDAGVAGTQLLSDAALNLVAPGAGTAGLALRSFGGGTQQARQHGADLAKQLGFGAASAAVATISEKLFDGLAGAYGKGVVDDALKFDDVLETLIGKLTKNAAGQRALKVLASAGGEAVEEIVEGAISPALESIYDGKSAGSHYGKGFLADLAYQALIGATLGGAGGAVEVASGRWMPPTLRETPQNTPPNAVASRTEIGEGNLPPATQNAPQAQETAKTGDAFTAAVRQQYAPQMENAQTPFVQAGLDAIRHGNRPGNSIVDAIAKDTASLAELGIDRSGKTASQLRAEVRVRLNVFANEKGVYDPNISQERAPDVMTSEAHRLFGSQETSTPQSVENENTFDAPTEQAYTESNEKTMQGGADSGAGGQLHGTVGERTFGGVSRTQEHGQGGTRERADGQGNLRSAFSVLNPGAVQQERNGESFSKALSEARESDAENGWAVTPKDAAELSKTTMLVRPDMSAGLAVAEDGDIEAVFRNQKGERGALLELMPAAIEAGGTKLDCYGAGLVMLYERFGFKPVCRVEFNPEYANPGWDERKGKPYIYFMVATDTDAQSVRDNAGNYLHATTEELNNLPTFGKDEYDAAYAYRDGLLKKRQSAPTAPRIDSVGAARAGFSPYYDMENAYGAQDGGVNAVRPDDAPISTNGQDLVSRSVVSAKGAAVTPDAFVPLLENDTANGEYSYYRISNNHLARQAQNYIMRRGWENALNEWREAAWSGNYTPQMNVVGQFLYNNAVNSGDFALARDIFALYQRTVRTNAQVVQSARILKNLSPETRLYMIEQQMQGVSEEMRAKAADNIPVEEWMTRVGEELAAYMERYGVNSARAQTTAQIIANDVRHFYAKDRNNSASRTRRAGRSEIDRITDLFRNREEYSDLWDAARARLQSDLGDSDGDALAAFEEWLDNAPNYADRLSFELTKDAGLRISDEAAAAYLGAETEAERDAAIERMQKEVGAQLPSSFADKWTALRYVNMLGNFKTQARNISGNIGMQALTRTKDATATLLEGLAHAVSGGRIERTKALFPGKERIAAAKDDFATMKKIVLGGGRYDLNEGRATGNDFMRGALEERIIFKGKSGRQNAVHKTLEAYRKATNKAMEYGDEIFAKGSYARALAGYLKAHGVSAAEFSSEEWRANNAGFVDAARAYAITEAQEATFRDNNAVSEWLSKLGRGKQASTFGKVMRAAGEGLLPFRKTPANVAVRAEEYSPLGLINTAVKAVQLHRGAENVTGADVINQLAKTITGTGVLALGWALAKRGLLRGGDDENEQQQYFDELNGHQSYAIELPDGTSYTLDWATPAAIPLFMGAELARLSEDNGLELSDLWGALSTLTDPMLEMSMLSSVNELIEKVRYGETNVVDLGGSLLVSYLTQGLTNTLLGQMERTTETERMATFVDKDSPLPDWLQREIGKASAKTPGWDYHQYPYIDPWGKREESGNLGERAFENFISPGYTSHISEGALEKELQRLADNRESTAIFPDLAPKSFKVGKENKRLTQEEYVAYAKQRGQESEAIIRALIGSKEYGKLTDEQKEDAISKAYEFANAEAKEAVSDYKVSESSWIIGARESALPLVDYLLAYESEGGSKYLTGSSGEKMDAAVAIGMSREDYIALRKNIDANGNGAVSQAEAKAYLDASDLSQEQKRNMWNIINAGWKKNPY